MALDYSEKRNFFRMNLDCDMQYTVNGSGQDLCGNVRNLSGDGISFYAGEQVEPGSEVSVRITPENNMTPPLQVIVEVLRCQLEGGRYVVSGNITKR